MISFLSTKTCASSDAEMGRYIVATRDLKPGELILTESPLVIGPMAVTVPICLGCYKNIDGKIKYVLLILMSYPEIGLITFRTA